MNRLLLLISAVLLVLAAPAAVRQGAGVRKATAKRAAQQEVVSAPVQGAHRRSPYVGAISVNAETGDVIFSDNADAEAYPASVTKLMTLLLVMEDVKAGKYSLDAAVEATADAYKSEPSWTP